VASFSVDKLQEGLRTKHLGKRIFFSRVVASTNEWAKELASYGAEEGTIAIAETQTAGRGRLGREWFSPKGGLYFSVVLRPALKPVEAVGLVFVAGLAVADVLRKVYCLAAETKWPNDVLVNGKKVCGVLSEMNSTGEEVNFVVVGVGVNADFVVEKVLPEELWERTTSLGTALGRRVKLEELFRALLEKLEDVYGRFLKEGFGVVVGEWKGYAGFLGKQVEVKVDAEKFEGLALNVDGEGALVVQLGNGALRRVFVGDVSLRMSSF
jgi:BirA family biotin operon repressor/biotin-[acetyl-CoA-carboxylase] ligase